MERIQEKSQAYHKSCLAIDLSFIDPYFMQNGKLKAWNDWAGAYFYHIFQNEVKYLLN